MNEALHADRKSDCTALAFDTSTSVLATALTRNGETLDSSRSFTERNHSVRIVSDLRDLMERAGVRREEVDVIAVGQGPGSYTGVRIAVSAAKTLAWAWGKPLVGVSSLEAIASGTWASLSARPDAGDEAWIVPLMDARRGQAYTSLFRGNRHGEWKRLEEDGIRLLADWGRSLSDRLNALQASDRPAAVYLVGETGFLEGKWNPPAEAPVPFLLEPSVLDAGAVGSLAERRFRRGEKDDVHGFVPNYTQLTEAEVNLMKAKTESAN